VIDELREELIEYIEDAHALERHVAAQLDVMVERTRDPETKELLLRHRRETEGHE
jgi:ferritin-like metal-binding protein YciE